MDRLRLDPDDPFASLMAWLAALARALGIDPSTILPKVRLDHASAAEVRRTLADWRRQLRAIVLAEAGRLAAGLAGSLPGGRSPADRPAPPSSGGAAGRLRGESLRAGDGPPISDAPISKVEARPLSLPAAPPRGSKGPSQPQRPRPDPGAWISDAEEAALSRRAQAVMHALQDRAALVRRIAGRLARERALAGRRRLARTRAALALLLRGRRRLPQPPRRLGAPGGRATRPALRPPNRPTPLSA